MKKLIIFDFDGTICDTRPAISSCLEAVASDNDIDVELTRKAIELTTTGGLTLPQTVEMLTEKSGKSAEELITEYREHYKKIGTQNSTLFSGVKETLDMLNRQSKSLIVISNKGATALASTLSHFQIMDMFRMAIGEMPGRPSKPAPELFDEVIKPHFPDIDKNEILMVGDTATDIAFARAIGIEVAWVSYGFGKELGNTSDYTFDSFAGVRRVALEYPQQP